MIAVVVAMEKEAAAVQRALPEDAVVFLSGVGKVNAAGAAMAAMVCSPDAVVNVGLAGGVGKDMEVGTAWSVSKAAQYDFDLSAVDGTEVGTLDGRDSPFFGVRAVPGLPAARCGTADHFGSGESDAAVLERLGCGLRDMECAAVAQICERYGKPFYAVKVVSDVAGGEGPMPEQYRANAEWCLKLLGDAARMAVEAAKADAAKGAGGAS